MTLVLSHIEEGVATLTLNRPDAMNALSRALQHALYDAIEDAERNAQVGVIILTGAGLRAFSAGLDLKEIAEFGLAMGPDGERGRDPVRRLAACKKPVIGAVNGVAITGGFELALTCDILIASENARFADTHARVGVVPGWGLSQILPRRIGTSRAKELSLSGNFLCAAEAAQWGLVNRVVPAAGLIDAAQALARDILSCDQDLVLRYKALIDDGMNLSFGEAMELEHARSQSANVAVTASGVAERRVAVQERGRVQRDP